MCLHEKTTTVFTDTVKEVSAEWITEYDDDGYPVAVLKDKEFTWNRPIIVCDQCGGVFQFDGWGLCELFEMSERAKYAVKQYKLGAGD